MCISTSILVGAYSTPLLPGILSGANRASPLRDPATALPHGTLGAVCLSFCLYSTYPPTH